MRNLGIVAMLAGTGCSLAMVRGAPSPLPTEGEIPCSSSYAMPIVDTTIAVVAIATGLALLASRDRDDRLGDQAPFAVVLTGATFGVSGINGFTKVANCRELRADARVDRADRALHDSDVQLRQRRERAWQLTKDAAAAARDGDCVTVKGLDLLVREIDREFHETVFLRDRGIAFCMAASTTDLKTTPTDLIP
ncbi:MAG: hypothetical protein ABI867_06510 [Kofleriaceae bacterium]